jgi:hypothetical protein
MMVTWTLRVLCGLLALAPMACGGGGGTSGSGGGNSGGVSANPTTVYRGRMSEVALTSPGAAYADTTPVTATGAMVSAVHAVSKAELDAQIDLPVDFTAAMLPVTVGGKPAVSLTVADALTAMPAPGWSLPQGNTRTIDLVNHDAAHPLDAGALAIDAGKGVDVFVDTRSPDALSLTLHALPTAAEGAHDLQVNLLDMKGGKAVASARVAGAFTVEKRTIVPLNIGMPTSFMVAAGDDGAYLSLSGIKGKLLDLQVTDAKSGGQPITPFMAMLSPDVGLKLPLSQITGDELFAPVDGDVLLYVGPADTSSGQAVSFTVSASLLTPVAANEAEPNDKTPMANSITLPALITASLDPDNDVDIFAVTVPKAGKLLVRTLSGPKGESADTFLQVESDMAMILGENDDEDAGMNDSYSFVRADVQPGTVYVRASVGSGGFALGAPYRLIAAIR